MKAILILMSLISTTVFATAQQGGVGAAGTPGVEDGSCWRGGNHDITVGVRGTMHGDQKVTVEEGDEEASGTGTPDVDGGCDESSEIKVDTEHYRAKNGKMQRKNDAGSWVDMSKTTCDPPPGGGATGPPPAAFGDTETIGSLPFAMVVLRNEDELFVSLPA